MSTHASALHRLATVLAAAFFLAGPADRAVGQGVSESIRANQVGYWTDGDKRAVVVESPTLTFEIRSPDLATLAYSGTLGGRQRWIAASDQEYARVAEFSDFETEGEWVVHVPGLGSSHPFRVGRRVHDGLTRAVLKAFWFARASTALPAAWAGPWARETGHPDTNVLVHASAASASRPAGTAIAAARGWYDAGDYNKYVVNSGITTATLLMLYERFPAYFDALRLEIPESDGGLPDLLDEVLWNLRWMMAMQDPEDGGVYHKLTTPLFEGAVMPQDAVQPRYVVQKTSSAALNFSAVAAIGARVFAGFPATRALSDSLLDAAGRAWVWAHYRESDLLYDQGAMNAAFDPDIQTGQYGDGDLYDEYRWASTELFITTGADSLLVMYNPIPASMPSIPSWNDVTVLGLWSLARHRAQVAGSVDTTLLRSRILERAEDLVRRDSLSAYGFAFGGTSSDYVWGSNSVAANQANMLLVAWDLKPDPRYLRTAIGNLDYLLGRNAIGTSFVTAFGERSPMHPHHRPSQADGVAAPVPGMLVGGVNPGRQDGCTYPFPANQPARSWVDDWCSYASNEVAINWQASLAFLAAGLEAVLSPDGLPASASAEPGPSPLPSGFEVEAWPNPARGAATVSFTLARDTTVKGGVYDLLGRRVLLIEDGGRLPAGRHERQVQAGSLAAGVYLVRFEADGAFIARPLIVTR